MRIYIYHIEKQEDEDILWYENLDIENIFTPVNADAYETLLKEVKYDEAKSAYLINGFREGFSLKYKGPTDKTRTAPNLKITVGSEVELWNKVMKEVKQKRYAGPYEKPPYDTFIQSPIRLVDKDGGKATRLIFHLSYPRGSETEQSINAGIDADDCTVKYPDFQCAVELCQKAGKLAFCSKSDMKSAFRHLPLKVSQFCLLLMKAKNPKDGKTYWFIEKCLPFGSSISCKIFQDFSDSIAFIVQKKAGKENINYLDDFLFIALLKQYCNEQVEMFLDICEQICFPVSMEKTVWAEQIIIFLGMMIDNINQVVCIPKRKVDKALYLINKILNGKNKKATVLNIQSLAGYLNFLCKAIVPGRAFTARLYSLVSSKLRPYHHVRIPKDVEADLGMWKNFLLHQNCYCRPFIDFLEYTSEDIIMYSDAVKTLEKGFGAYCENDWMMHSWSECGQFLIDQNPSIAYLELFAIKAAVKTWIHRFANRRICLFTDNENAKTWINKSSSRCKNSMVLIRMITLEAMKHNVRISAKYIESSENVLSDALSRGDLKRFWENAPESMNIQQTLVPADIWRERKFGSNNKTIVHK